MHRTLAAKVRVHCSLRPQGRPLFTTALTPAHTCPGPVGLLASGRLRLREKSQSGPRRGSAAWNPGFVVKDGAVFSSPWGN